MAEEASEVFANPRKRQSSFILESTDVPHNEGNEKYDFIIYCASFEFVSLLVCQNIHRGIISVNCLLVVQFRFLYQHRGKCFGFTQWYITPGN